MLAVGSLPRWGTNHPAMLNLPAVAGNKALGLVIGFLLFIFCFWLLCLQGKSNQKKLAGSYTNKTCKLAGIFISVQILQVLKKYITAR